MTSTTQITGLGITSDNIKIDYKVLKQGLLSKTAFDAATLNGRPLEPSGISEKVFRSVGYYGIGFGGNKYNGQAIANYTLDKLDLKLYTHINLAFFATDSQGTIIFPNSQGTKGGAIGDEQPEWLTNIVKTTGFPYVRAILTALNEQRKKSNNPDVKLIPSIGGWNVANDSKYGKNLTDLGNDVNTTDQTMFKKFISNITELFDNNLIDGIDVDWEYPGRDIIVSNCVDGNNNNEPRPCKVNEPTEIATCVGKPSPCVHYKITNGEKMNGTKSCGYPYNYPSGPPTPKPKSYTTPSLTTMYFGFMTELKKEMKKANLAAELSIALAGAPWGLHWYINTVAKLLATTPPTIDYANIMAYDYSGFWSNGDMSGFLSNMTNMKTYGECNRSGFNGCVKEIKFTNTKNSLTLPTTPGLGCPLIYWNALGDYTTPTSSIPSSDINDITNFQSNQWNDNEIIPYDPDIHGVASSSHHITLSVQTVLNLLTNTEKGFGINPKQLVLGLPYYGRAFQKEVSFGETYGLFARYDYGAPYSFNDIYSKHYKTDKKQNVYEVPLTTSNPYVEEIVYVKNKDDIMTTITDDMAEEMISYNSVDSIKYKVDYITTQIYPLNKNALNHSKLGGYMCWHMLSDYYA